MKPEGRNAYAARVLTLAFWQTGRELQYLGGESDDQRIASVSVMQCIARRATTLSNTNEGARSFKISHCNTGFARAPNFMQFSIM